MAGINPINPSASLADIAKKLGGEVSSGQALVPGPGHSAIDRSLSIKLDAAAPDGFLVNSFSGDDPLVCKDYVRGKLGLAPFGPSKGNGAGKAWTQISEHIYLDERAEPYLKVRKCRDENGRKQYPQAHRDGQQWISGKPAGAKVPYRLPELIAATATTPVFIVEGKSCCDVLAKLGFVTTTNSEGADDGKGKKWTADLNRWFAGRKVVLIGDNDAPGRKHVEHVAKNLQGIAETVQVLDLAPHWPGEPMPIGDDVADWIERHDRAGSKLAQLASKAPAWAPATDQTKSGGTASNNRLITELVALRPFDYAKRRGDAAKQLGVTTGALDKEVNERRKESEKVSTALPHWHVGQWPDKVASNKLLDSIVDVFTRYIVSAQARRRGACALDFALLDLRRWRHFTIYGAEVADKKMRQNFDTDPALLADAAVRACEQYQSVSNLPLYRGSAAGAGH